MIASLLLDRKRNRPKRHVIYRVYGGRLIYEFKGTKYPGAWMHYKITKSRRRAARYLRKWASEGLVVMAIRVSRHRDLDMTKRLLGCEPPALSY